MVVKPQIYCNRRLISSVEIVKITESVFCEFSSPFLSLLPVANPAGLHCIHYSETHLEERERESIDLGSSNY